MEMAFKLLNYGRVYKMGGERKVDVAAGRVPKAAALNLGLRHRIHRTNNDSFRHSLEYGYRVICLQLSL